MDLSNQTVMVGEHGGGLSINTKLSYFLLYIYNIQKLHHYSHYPFP